MNAAKPLVRRLGAQMRVLARKLLARLRSAGYLRKWIILGAAIGIIAGLGAALFLGALRLSTHYLLGALGGFTPATTAGEGGIHPASAFARPWAIPLVVALGALLSAILVFRFAPEAEGHGTDAAIDAVHHNAKGMHPRVTLVKFVASALTIGSGGSGGREGPTAQISASFGSMIARWLNLSPADARIAVSAGIASGIGAIFRAPLGGAMLGVELLYRNDFEFKSLLPSIVASIVSFAVFGSIWGFDPIFGFHSDYHFSKVSDLLFFIVLGLAAGAMGRLYAATFHRTSETLHKIPVHPVIRATVGGAAVGGLGLLIPGVLGTGYGQVQQALDAPAVLAMPLILVVAIPFGKILATALSIGSGGSGGIFGPGMVIGGVTGAAVWRVCQPLFPSLPPSPVPFVIIGMIACFGSIAHAHISVMIMVGEMTGNLSLLAPAMVALALATAVVGDRTIYRAQLADRTQSPAFRFTYALPLAATLPVTEVMSKPKLVLAAGTSVADARRELAEHAVPGAPVVDGSGRYRGRLSLQDLPPAGDGSAPAVPAVIDGFVDRVSMTIPAEAHLDAAIDALAQTGGTWVPVISAESAVLGIVGASDVVRGYRSALQESLRRLGRDVRGAVLTEELVHDGAPVAGRRVGAMGLGPMTVVSLQRDGNLLFPDGRTVLQAGDLVSILAPPGNEDALRAAFGGDPPAPHGDGSDSMI